MGELMIRNLQVNPRFAEPYWPNLLVQELRLPDRAGNGGYGPDRPARDLVLRGRHQHQGHGQSPAGPGPSLYDDQARPQRRDAARGQDIQAARPAHVPVKQFWALTLYSENTRRPYDNGGAKVKDVSLDSRMKQLKYNAASILSSVRKRQRDASRTS
jgi:hypothetical protein